MLNEKNEDDLNSEENQFVQIFKTCLYKHIYT